MHSARDIAASGSGISEDSHDVGPVRAPLPYDDLRHHRPFAERGVFPRARCRFGSRDFKSEATPRIV